MDAGLLAQYLVLALLVLASLWVVMRSQFPATTRKLRIALALPLLREGRAAWQQKLGRWIAPAGSSANDAACGGCNGCGPDKKG